MRLTPALAVLAALVVPSLALADRRELYTSIEVAPGLVRVSDPVTERYTTSAGVIGGSITVAYGVTNELHIGGALHYAQGSDIAFRGSTVVLTNGTQSTGTVYMDVRSMGATLLAQYRFHLRTRMVPFVQAEVGLTSLSYENVVHVPSAASYGVPFPNVTEVALEVRAGAGLEYRFGDSVVASVALQAVVTPGALQTAGLQIPVSLGWIW